MENDNITTNETIEIIPTHAPDFRLSASNASRWMTCRGWYPLNNFVQKHRPEHHRALRILDNRSPDYITDGRMAHALAALDTFNLLVEFSNRAPLLYPGTILNINYSGREEDMIGSTAPDATAEQKDKAQIAQEFMNKYHGFIRGYSNMILNKITSILEIYKFKPKGQKEVTVDVFIENTIRLETPDGSVHSTTPDTYILITLPNTNKDSHLYVYDFKFGSGEPVSAIRNKQLCFYIISVCQAHAQSHPNIKAATTIIYQPRCLFADTTTSEDSYDEGEILTLKDIIQNRIKEITEIPTDTMPAIEHFTESDECGWCPHKVVCPMKAKAVALAKRIQELPAVEFLTPENFKFILDNFPAIVKYGDAVKDYALARVKEGSLSIPGYELADGRSARTWDTSMMSVDEIAEMLKSRGVENPFQPPKLKGITEVEDAIGKDKISDLTRKSIPGKVLKKVKTK